MLDPLPCWSQLSPREVQRRVREVVRDIEQEAAVERRKTGQRSRGAEAVMAMDPHFRPEKLESSSAPMFHAARKHIRRAMWEAYAWVVKEYREAAERLREGDRLVAFPEGTFPPGLAFVPFLRGHPA